MVHGLWLSYDKHPYVKTLRRLDLEALDIIFKTCLRNDKLTLEWKKLTLSLVIKRAINKLLKILSGCTSTYL